MTSPTLQQQLQASLGAAYRIERELGGGGMSRVFVAEEVALARKVVVKVLSPELAAAVNVERFRREILLAAQLQHPHIVPLLAAGVSNGLPYYTMPLVTGESLRARISSSGQLPVNEAVRILREVLSALSYAHEQGVVHRDIKPDNVLLSKHHAVVTDFGVAKALSAATNSGDMLTVAGVALGTPAYMAPEQALADPDTDHRADIYAAGVMAYEMLTGEKLFSDRSPQKMIAAHAIEAPERIENKRPDIPPALASVIMRALEKHPPDRPQSADEMLASLDAIGPSSGATAASSTIVSGTTQPGRSRVRYMAIGGAALAAIVASIVIYSAQGGSEPATVLDKDLVVVVPFRVGGAESSLAYLREGMLDLLAAKLTGEGGPRAADPRSVLSAWRRLSTSSNEDLSASENVRLAQNLGAGQVILGGIVGTPARLVVNATVLEVPSGKPVRTEVTVEGPADSLASLVDQLAVKLLSLQAGEDQQNLAELASSSLPAIRSYLEGKAAYRRGRYELASKHFTTALEIDSTFALSAIGLIVSANWAGIGNLIAVGIRHAWHSQDKLSERDRLLLLSYVGTQYPFLPSISDWQRGLERAVNVAPDQPDILYEYGDAMWHFGRAIEIPDAMKIGSDMFARAFARDSSFAPAIEHLLEHAANTGDKEAVRHLQARYLALDSAADHATYIRWRAAIALGDSQALRDIRKNFGTIDPQNAGRIAGMALLEGIGLGDADVLEEVIGGVGGPTLGRSGDFALGLALSRGYQQRAKSIQIAGIRGNTDDALFNASSMIGQILYWDADKSGAPLAIAVVDRFAFVSPSPRQRPESFAHIAACTSGLWRLSNDDVDGAQDAVRVMKRTLSSAKEEGIVTTAPTCLPYLEAAIGIRLDPSSLAARLPALDSLSLVGSQDFFWLPFNIELARLFDASGNPRKALDVIRRRPYHWADGTSYLSTFLRDEGKYAVKAGDTQSAVRAYSHYLRLREKPDPPLRPQVDSVRAELARIGRAR